LRLTNVLTQYMDISILAQLTKQWPCSGFSSFAVRT